ncbi:peroxiredoxin-like family protein [Spirillospora albida]|uniref:peroxiredoxin-like family protein n=1 Tax=Spirillospora albida TaxID=58123 RepID=UPI0004BE5A30|nr:peroxiredoxin-like family protein [Spirillospora albida]
MHLVTGSDIPARDLTPVNAAPITIPAPGRLVHLQFRRFAGCPICNLHLRAFTVRHAELEAAGITEVAVFHSPAEELAGHVDDLPFPVIADPGKALYREFGVESSRRSLLDPRAWPGIVLGVLHGTWRLLRGRGKLPARSPAGGRLGLPGDFLIAPDGRLLAAKYGEHANDQWSLDEVLAQAARNPAPSAQ